METRTSVSQPDFQQPKTIFLTDITVIGATNGISLTLIPLNLNANYRQIQNNPPYKQIIIWPSTNPPEIALINYKNPKKKQPKACPSNCQVRALSWLKFKSFSSKLGAQESKPQIPKLNSQFEVSPQIGICNKTHSFTSRFPKRQSKIRIQWGWSVVAEEKDVDCNKKWRKNHN